MLLLFFISLARSNGLAVNGKKLRNYLLNVSLSDLSSSFRQKELLFDTNGDVQGFYIIYNFQELTMKNGPVRVCVVVQIALPLGVSETDMVFHRAVHG